MKRLAILLGFVAAGCTTLGPDYERPPVALPASFPQAAAGAAAGVAADWWTLYGDAELTRLVERALLANADLAQAVARVELADALWREVGGARQPAVDFGASTGRVGLGAESPSNPAGRSVVGNDFRFGLSAAYEIDFWGRLRRADEAARAGLLASEAARDTVRLSVAALVAQAWFGLRSLDEQGVATRQVLKSREDSLRLVGLRLQAGTASRLDAEQADILRADAALQLRELQRQRALALSLLGALTGDAALDLPEGTLRATTLPPLPPPGLPSALLERRPDVRRAEQGLVAANAQIGVARAAMFPTVSLTGALGQESADLGRILTGAAGFWSLRVALALPLFDGGRSAARVDQAGARQREALGAYQAAVATAFREVADALANERAARESAADLEARAAAAGRALELARSRFDAGYSGYLEFLEAQRSETAARLDALRNRQARLAASVELMKALGGGWGER